DCGGPAGAAERIYRREAGRDGGALQALEMDGGAGGVAGSERGVAGDRGNANDAGGAVGLEADADGKNYSGFSEREDAGIRGDGIEFCGRGRVRGGASAGGGARQG